MRKLIDTIRMGTVLMLARTFGAYQHTTWDPDNGGLTYHEYRWRGRRYAFPAGPLEEDEF